MHFLEDAAGAEDVLGDALDSCLEDGTGCFGNAVQVILRDAASAEDVTVCEVLGGQVADWELRQDDLGAGGGELIELIVNDIPLSINNLLEFLGTIDPDLGIVLFGLQL